MNSATCPLCGLLGPPEQVRCDCGYDFELQRRPPESHTLPQKRAVGGPLLVLSVANGICAAAATVTYWFLATTPFFKSFTGLVPLLGLVCSVPVAVIAVIAAVRRARLLPLNLLLLAISGCVCLLVWSAILLSPRN